MGIRHLLNPPLPAGYYGNAFQSANAVLTGRDLNKWPLSRVAKMIKESKKVASDTNYIWYSINLLEKLRHHKMKIETGSECLVLTDWRQLGVKSQIPFSTKTKGKLLVTANANQLQLTSKQWRCRLDPRAAAGATNCRQRQGKPERRCDDRSKAVDDGDGKGKQAATVYTFHSKRLALESGVQLIEPPEAARLARTPRDSSGDQSPIPRPVAQHELTQHLVLFGSPGPPDSAVTAVQASASFYLRVAALVRGGAVLLRHAYCSLHFFLLFRFVE
ncbi:hypothetical protein RJ639_044281 [Escallonia herrerae]|uniref:Uncharacterized protein n=1 Tax=Escallonia herrerae TaxID=1293975 RepID=A0AA88WL53_9ASTE|nr:hypothetical protein RJ639_044281 [Escallonia herrerae]